MSELSPVARRILDELEWIQRTRVALPLTIDELRPAVRAPRRDIEAGIQELRLAGHPIVTDGRGVRLTDDPAEVEACVAALRGRLRTQYRTVRRMQRTARAMRQPATLWDGMVIPAEIRTA